MNAQEPTSRQRTRTPLLATRRLIALTAALALASGLAAGAGGEAGGQGECRGERDESARGEQRRPRALA